MDESLLVYANNLIQIGVITYLLARSLQAARRAGEIHAEAALLLLAFALATNLASDLYWLVHLFLTQNPYLSLSVDDVASTGLFSLLAASLAVAHPGHGRTGIREAAACLAVVGVHVYLWIMWSGDVLRNIVSGLALWYLCSVIVHALREDEALTRPQAIGLMMLTVLNTLCPLVQYAVEALRTSAADTVVSCMLLAQTLAILYMALRAPGTDAPCGSGCAALAYAAYACAHCAMYLSFEPLYSVADLCVTAALPLMLRGIERSFAATRERL